ncbi:MAG TPA: hypothetical protein VIL55_14835 [Naasia sp.]
MGAFFYDRWRYEFEDRALAHLRHVLITRLRRGESFELSWNIPIEAGSGRQSLWMHPNVPLRFTFDDAHIHPISRAWIDALMGSSFTTAGLQFVPEPVVPPAA